MKKVIIIIATMLIAFALAISIAYTDVGRRKSDGFAFAGSPATEEEMLSDEDDSNQNKFSEDPSETNTEMELEETESVESEEDSKDASETDESVEETKTETDRFVHYSPEWSAKVDFLSVPDLTAPNSEISSEMARDPHMVGRLYIPNASVDGLKVGTTNTPENAQEVIDSDSAIAEIFGEYPGWTRKVIVIGDHVTEGFRYINSLSVGDKAYLNTGDRVIAFTLVYFTPYVSYNGGQKLAVSYENALVIRTCAGGSMHMVAVFVPDGGEMVMSVIRNPVYTIGVDESGKAFWKQ